MIRSTGVPAVAAALAALLAAACTPGNGDPSAPYFPKTRPVASTPAPLDPALAVPPAPLVAAVGAVSRPNLQVTPGAVAVHDAAVLCQQARHAARPPIPSSWDQVIFNEYGIPLKEQGKYRLDFLVPLELGGAQVQQNLWPMSLRGTGFHEKQRLNARLRDAVCQAVIPLDQAQHDIVTDWFALWVRYAAY